MWYTTRFNFIYEQYSWNNTCITFHGKPIFDETLYKHKRVSDLLTEYGRFNNWENISNEFNLTSVQILSWFDLLQAIPNLWSIY